MKLLYDRETDALLIQLVAGREYHESQEISPGVVVDFDRDGHAIALEVEGASQYMEASELAELAPA